MRGLTARLARVAELVGHVRCVADIGSDHGLLPVALVRERAAKAGVAVELTDGPFGATQEAVLRAGLQDAISVRQGDGLHPLAPFEADAIVLAGMGGQTIWNILTSSRAATVLTAEPVRLVVQPMGGSGLIRYWAGVYGYRIAADVRVRDSGVVYECLRLDAGVGGARMPAADWVGVAPQRRREFEELGSDGKWRFAFGEYALQVGCQYAAEQMRDEGAKLRRALRELAYPKNDRAYARAVALGEDLAALSKLYESVFKSRF
ncbi:MAG: tRNA (adenine(22)-N(1))-methyltransferase [Bacilli bacterium]